MSIRMEYLPYSRYLASTAAMYEVSFSMFTEWDLIIFEGFAMVDPSVYSPYSASYKSVFPNYIIALEAYRRTLPAEEINWVTSVVKTFSYFFKSVSLQAKAEKTFNAPTEEACLAGAVIGAF